jgi:hypothetical protein
MRAVGKQLVARIVEKAFERVDVQLQLAAFVDIARPVDAHLAGGGGQVVGHGVFHAVGVDHRIAAAQLGIAFDHGALVGLAPHALARNKHRQLRARRLGNLFAQLRAAA